MKTIDITTGVELAPGTGDEDARMRHTASAVGCHAYLTGGQAAPLLEQIAALGCDLVALAHRHGPLAVRRLDRELTAALDHCEREGADRAYERFVLEGDPNGRNAA